MKLCLLFSALGLLSASYVNAATVSCGIGKNMDTPLIKFSEISEGLRLEDFAEIGQFGLTAVVTGNGKTATFATNLDYKKVGDRIEFIGPTYVRVSQVTMDQFQSEFGLFPEVSCSTP